MKWLVMACLGIAGGIFYWVLDPVVDEGLVVVVHVLDTEGQPVPRASVAAVYGETRAVVDRDGRARLTHVVLRDGDAAGADSLSAALRVEAPYAAARGGRLPEVEQRQGTWHVSYRLSRYGILRLGLYPSELDGVHAYAEPDETGDRWEPIGGYSVARHPTMVSYRVYAGTDRVPVRMLGDMGVAMRRMRVPAPSPGHTRELILKPLPARAILGRIEAPEASAAARVPTLAGHAHVAYVDETGTEIQMPSVVVQPSGAFIIPYTGEGHYRVRPELPFLMPLEAQVIEAGKDGVWERTRARPFVRLDHPAVDSRVRRPRVSLTTAEGEAAELPTGGVYVAGLHSLVALPRPGHYRLRVHLPGTQDEAPMQAEIQIEAFQEGAQPPHALVPEPAPHGAIEVVTGEATLGSMRGATVTVGWDRRLTWMKGLQRSVTVRHLETQTRAPVRVVWADRDMAMDYAEADVDADATRTVMVKRERGGPVTVIPETTRDAGQRALHLHILPEQSPYGAVQALRVVCPWDSRAGHWQSRHALKPGAYVARLALDGDSRFKEREIRFEVRAGESTRVQLNDSAK